MKIKSCSNFSSAYKGGGNVDNTSIRFLFRVYLVAICMYTYVERTGKSVIAMDYIKI